MKKILIMGLVVKLVITAVLGGLYFGGVFTRTEPTQESKETIANIETLHIVQDTPQQNNIQIEDLVVDRTRRGHNEHYSRSYNNDTLSRYFSDGLYFTTSNASEQQRQSPLMLTEFQIIDFRFAYDRMHGDIGLFHPAHYFTLDIGGNRLALSRQRVEQGQPHFVRLTWNGQTQLQIPLADWHVRDTASRYSTAWSNGSPPGQWRFAGWNSFSFELRTENMSDLRWILQWGHNRGNRIGDVQVSHTAIETGLLLGGATHVLSTENSLVSTLGLTNVHMNPFRGAISQLFQRIHYRGAFRYNRYFGDRLVANEIINHYPTLMMEGYEAVMPETVDLYLEGAFVNTVIVPANTFFGWHNLIVPSHMIPENMSIQWFINPQMTIPLERHFMATEFQRLYGQLVAERVEIALSFWETQRTWIQAQTAFYEALVWRTVYRWFNVGEVITTNRFGIYSYGIPFYDRVVGIEFNGWDGGIGKAATEDLHIRALYTFPQVTLRYFSNNEQLFGDVQVDIERMPLSYLHQYLHLIEIENDATPPNFDNATNFRGMIWGVVRAVDWLLFGSRTDQNEINALMREQQRRETLGLVRRLIIDHNPDNQIFMPIVRLDVNLEDVSGGTFRNTNFNVDPVRNPQWRLISGTPEANDLIYAVDFFDTMSLGATHNFTLVVTFNRYLSGWELFWINLGHFFSRAWVWIVAALGGILLISLGWMFRVELAMVGSIIVKVFYAIGLFLFYLFAILLFPIWKPILILGKKATGQ